MTGTASARRLVASARAAFAQVPDEAMEAARLHLVDALSVGLLASRTGPVRGVAGMADGTGTCTILGSSQRAPESSAALINGTLIHSLEFDDTHVASVMHGGSVMAPVALAAAEATGSSGRDMLAAFAVGWEILIRIGLASPGRIQARGFQITSAAGAFAAAVVAGLLHDDDEAVIANAVGIAGSQAGGTFAFLRDGDTVKAAQPGWSAHAGVLALDLARAGVTGPDGVFGGRYGFFSLYADDPDGADALGRQLDDLGSRWHLADAAFKLVPCCHYIHPFVEALDIVRDRGVRVDDVVSVHCWVPTGAAPVIAEPWEARQHPAKAHDARWSLPYVVALALRDGTVTASDFDGECDPDLVAIAERVTYEPWEDSGFPQVFPARIALRTTDGTVHDVAVDDVRGGALRPVDSAAVEEKAAANLREAGMAADAVARLVAQFRSDGYPDVAALHALLELP